MRQLLGRCGVTRYFQAKKKKKKLLVKKPKSMCASWISFYVPCGGHFPRNFSIRCVRVLLHDYSAEIFFYLWGKSSKKKNILSFPVGSRKKRSPEMAALYILSSPLTSSLFMTKITLWQEKSIIFRLAFDTMYFWKKNKKVCGDIYKLVFRYRPQRVLQI